MLNPAFCVAFACRTIDRKQIAIVILPPHLKRVQRFDLGPSAGVSIDQTRQFNRHRFIVDQDAIGSFKWHVPKHMSHFRRISHDAALGSQVNVFVNNLQSARILETPKITVTKSINPIRHRWRTKPVMDLLAGDIATTR